MGATFLREASIDARRTRPRAVEEAILFREGAERTCPTLRRTTDAAKINRREAYRYSARAQDRIILATRTP